MEKASVYMELDEITADIGAWARFKNSTLNSKDAAVLLGDAPWRTQEELLAEKKGFVTFSPKKDSAEAKKMQEKMAQQGKVKDVFIQKTGIRLLEGAVFRNRENPNLVSVIRHRTRDEIPVMITSTNSRNAKYWDKKVPSHVMDEAQWNMMVTGAPKCLVGCLLEDATKPFEQQDVKMLEVSRDETLIRKLRDEADRFQKKMAKNLIFVPLEPNLVRTHPTKGDTTSLLQLPADNPLHVAEACIPNRYIGQQVNFGKVRKRYLMLPLYNQKGESFTFAQDKGGSFSTAEIFCSLYGVRGRMLRVNNRVKSHRLASQKQAPDAVRSIGGRE